LKHFSEAQWADFARNLLPPATKMTMRQHLDQGCKPCAATLQLWQNVREIAERESTFTPHENVVRVVKSQFAAVMPEPSRGVRLVFDSNLQPITAGIRGGVAVRQFLYETDEYYIDLRLEPRRERACLVGQVLNRGGKARGAELAVRLQKGKVPVAQTTANQFGEFQLEFEINEGLCISISSQKESEVILPLYGVHGKPVERKDLD
jgi:hypothetical protein